jgi:hypothetical protein
MLDAYDHIFLEDLARSERYTATPTGGGGSNIPERDRISHATHLLTQFDQIWGQVREIKQEREAISLPTRQGTYLEFKSGANKDLITKSLENINQGIRLLNIRSVNVDNNDEIRATVYVPKGKENIFINKIKDYSDPLKDTIKQNPKNAPLVKSIEDVQLAFLESLWTDASDLIPDEIAKWCEVWLRIDEPDKDNKQVEHFTNLLKLNDLEYKGNAIYFPERAILLIKANRDQLTQLMMETDMLAEIRIGQEAASFWRDERNSEQSLWAEDLLKRLNIEDTDIKVCILDSGVNNGHILLSPLIENEDCLTIDPTWGTDDRSEIAGQKGHGTLMAGIVGYGDLQKALESKDQILLTHKICSVKILPSVGQSDPENWGDFTQQAVSRSETRNREKVLLYCMAVTSKDDLDKGKPSSWSGAIDMISFGRDSKKRLFIISGGNIKAEDCWLNYPEGNRLFSIHNPAQSWNALTVGAYTEKFRVDDNRFKDYVCVAPPGGLSPFSTTSSLWSNTKWPIKPEVVFEGGNLLKTNENDGFDYHPDLEILSTARNSDIRLFDTFNATSAATAQASYLAAQLAYKYPNCWPETIRALIVHSASWTDQMISQFNTNIQKKESVHNLLRIFGYGVPDTNRALNSFENGLTFIAQEDFQPFIREGSSYKTNIMHFYDLPWPKDLLLSLGSTPVKLRITLSYFIEPGPGEVGWKDKYRYQSYGLRFDVNNIGETETEFRKRINKAAREIDEKAETESGSSRWIIGKDRRSLGSIHSDLWEDTAANIADCNLISVYPVIGWWRERHNLKRYNSKGRYSLIVSLDTPSEEINLYTTIQTLIKIKIPVEVSNTL